LTGLKSRSYGASIMVCVVVGWTTNVAVLPRHSNLNPTWIIRKNNSRKNINPVLSGLQTWKQWVACLSSWGGPFYPNLDVALITVVVGIIDNLTLHCGNYAVSSVTFSSSAPLFSLTACKCWELTFSGSSEMNVDTIPASSLCGVSHVCCLWIHG